MNGPTEYYGLPLRVRVLLWSVSQIERFLLENCPKGRFRRLGLAWVDQTYAQVRAWLERANGDAHR